jgi:hypothetical protein
MYPACRDEASGIEGRPMVESTLHDDRTHPQARRADQLDPPVVMIHFSDLIVEEVIASVRTGHLLEAHWGLKHCRTVDLLGYTVCAGG